jgi:hypothetical protein
MAPALQGTRYLLSVLQHVLKDQSTAARLRLSPLVKQTLLDWKLIASDLAAHPVPVASLVPRPPHFAGAVDASGSGCGGFWVNTTHGSLPQPLAFRLEFPPDIQAQLVSSSNPSGTLSNSDFELAAITLGVAIIQDNAPTRHACLYTASDNTPAIAWCAKGSTSSIGANAHLLCWIAQLVRNSALTLIPVSVTGDSNLIADFCSRSFHLQDTSRSWKLAHPTPEHVHSLTSALLRKMLPWPSVARDKGAAAPPSTSGTNSATHLTSTQPWQTAPTPSQPSSSSPIGIEQAKLLPMALRSAVKRWATPFAPWDRRLPAWVSPTPVFQPGATSIYA